MARSPASGVRRSWDTQATSSRRDCSIWRSRAWDVRSRSLLRASSSPTARISRGPEEASAPPAGPEPSR